MFESKALEALGAFPIVQAAVAILVVLAGIYLMRRGEKDKKPSSIEPVPQWLMMGPAHDAIGAVHDIAEQGRVQIHILERIETVLKDGAKEQRVQTQLLEQIANENIINPRRLRE